jgi:hypothetical protein
MILLFFHSFWRGIIRNYMLGYYTFHPIFIVLPKNQYIGLYYKYNGLGCGYGHMVIQPLTNHLMSYLVATHWIFIFIF